VASDATASAETAGASCRSARDSTRSIIELSEGPSKGSDNPFGRDSGYNSKITDLWAGMLAIAPGPAG
jgi:hypothetical protein